MSAAISSSSNQDDETIKSGTMLVEARSGPSLTCIKVLKPPEKMLSGIRYSTNSKAWDCTFSRDGTWLAACYGAPDTCIRIWQQTDDASWVLNATLEGVQTRTIRSLSFAPTRIPILASASFDGTIAVWEYADKIWECTAQLEGHDNEVKCCRWNSTGSLLATSGRDKTVWLWECFLPGTIGGPDLQSNDATGGDFECLAVLNGHEGDVKCVEFAPSHGQWGDGDEILLSGAYDDTIKVWAEDAGDWYCAASLSAHSSTVWSLAISPGGSRLISGSADCSLGIFKCYTNKEKKSLFPEADRGSNGLWKCVGKLPNAHSAAIYSVSYAPSRAGHGRIASSGADNCIHIYREAMGSSSDQPLFSIDAIVSTDHGDVNRVCWHPFDGSILASAGDDGMVRLWRYRM
jgi:WD40 repeat protein